MRREPLTRSEKEAVSVMLKNLRLMPPAAGQVVFSIDPHGNVGCIEIVKVILR